MWMDPYIWLIEAIRGLVLQVRVRVRVKVTVRVRIRVRVLSLNSGGKSSVGRSLIFPDTDCLRLGLGFKS